MAKKECKICLETCEQKVVKDTTPQGWPMVVEECTNCHNRVLTNDPKADFLEAGGKLKPEHKFPEDD